ncbi:MAG: DUF547 domain-containing protein [Bacteroidota bacterium]
MKRLTITSLAIIGMISCRAEHPVNAENAAPIEVTTSPVVLSENVDTPVITTETSTITAGAVKIETHRVEVDESKVEAESIILVDDINRPKVEENQVEPSTEVEEVEPSSVEPQLDNDKDADEETESDSKVQVSEPQVVEEESTIVRVVGLVTDHSAWDQLLQQYVSSAGLVDYSGLKKKESQLDAYLESLSGEAPKLTDLSNAAKAYWINAYNAYTIKLILKNYPVSSITDLHGGKPWDVKWINLGGNTYSLNDIEHQILRPKFDDARIHFAVNCAAVSCPKVSNKAFTSTNIESQLESLTTSFVNNKSANTIGKNKVVVSKIFDWYGEDFGDLVAFLDKYATTDVNSSAQVTFQEYNWSLNGK